MAETLEGGALGHLTCKGRLRRLMVYFFLHHGNESWTPGETLSPFLRGC